MPLEIVDVRLYPVREPVSGRTYSILRLRTQSGLTGWGECSGASARALTEQRVSGKAAPRRPTYRCSRGPLTGALDMALLDIVGKAAKAPVYRVLGGPTRNKARVFTSVGAAGGLKEAAAVGHRAFGIRLPSPAARNQGQAYAHSSMRLVEMCGPRVAISFWTVRGCSPPAMRPAVASELEKSHPLWFDEPCAITNQETIRKIADESTVPLGFGRAVETPGAFQASAAGRAGGRGAAGHLACRHHRRAPHRRAGGDLLCGDRAAPRGRSGGHRGGAAPRGQRAEFLHPTRAAARSARRSRDARAIVSAGLETAARWFSASFRAVPGLGIAVNEAALEKYHAA